jgi:hypothetical protein
LENPVKKVVRILVVALVATASYSAMSTPTSAKDVEKGQTLSMGGAPLPDCPPSICVDSK